MAIGLSSLYGAKLGLNAVGNTARDIADLARDALAMLPQQIHTVSVRVYGDATSQRDSLTFVAMNLVMFRLANAVSGIPLGGVFYNNRSFKLTHDIMHKFVQVDAIISTGPLATLFGPQLGPLVNPLQNMEGSPITAYSPVNAVTSGSPQNPYPRGSDILFPAGINGQEQAARGTFLESMVAAALAPTYIQAGGVNTFLPPFNQDPFVDPIPIPRTP